MMQEQLQELIQECEQGLKVWPRQFETRQAHIVSLDRAGEMREHIVATKGELEDPSISTVTILFSKIVNGEHSTVTYDFGEGKPIPKCETFEEAIEQFRMGWAKFRAANPGDTLLWRVRPTLESFYDLTTGKALCYVRARAAIVTLPEKATV